MQSASFIHRTPKSVVFAAAAAIGGFIATVLSEFTVTPMEFAPLVGTALWSALICSGIVLAIVMLQNILLRKPALIKESITPVLVGGVVGGAVAGGAAQLFYSISAEILFSDGITPLLFLLHNVFVRSIAWGMMGGLAALGMSYCIPNLNRKWAVLGGLIGGIVGCIFFLIICLFTGDWLGRLLGTAILGACIGAMIGFVEQFYRNIWLMVLYDPRNFTQVNLGSQVITVGSGASDTVFVKDVGAKAASFLVVGDKVRYTDANGTQSLVPGNKVKVGNVELVICSKDVQFAPSKFYPMKMSLAREFMKKS